MMATMTPENEPGPLSGTVARRLQEAARRARPLSLPKDFVELTPQPRDVCYDTEFIDDGKTIELVSFGAIDHQGTYYAVNADVNQERILRHPFLRDQVWPKLPLRALVEPYVLTLEEGDYYPGSIIVPQGRKPEILVTQELNLDHPAVKPKTQIRDEVHNWLVPQGWNSLQHGPAVRLWAWFASYDHVALAQLFGAMVALPPGVPMRTGDLAQEADRLGVAKEQMPTQDETWKHHALADAEHDWIMMQFLRRYAREKGRV